MRHARSSPRYCSCDRQGLIGRELFAIDGVKLPSNASKAKSGARADFEREATKMDVTVQRMLTEPPVAATIAVAVSSPMRGMVSSRVQAALCRAKVDGQWKLYCLVHNIEKLGHHGYAN